MGFVGTLSFSLSQNKKVSANYYFTKEYHLYKGTSTTTTTNNTHTPYDRLQSILLDQHCRNESNLFDFSPSEF